MFFQSRSHNEQGNNEMNKLKLIIIGVLIGLCLGLWFGVNIGKGKALLSNPFAEISLKDRIKEKGTKVMKDTKDAIRDSLKE